MKKAKSWFKTLEEPYKTKAINNTPKDMLKLRYNTLAEALLGSFIWNDSEEGHFYWEKLEKELNNN